MNPSIIVPDEMKRPDGKERQRLAEWLLQFLVDGRMPDGVYAEAAKQSGWAAGTLNNLVVRLLRTRETASPPAVAPAAPLVDIHDTNLAIFGTNGPTTRMLRDLTGRGILPHFKLGRLARYDVRSVRVALNATCSGVKVK